MAAITSFVIKLNGIDVSEKLAYECIKSGKEHNLIISPFNGIYGDKNISNCETMLEVFPRGKIKKKRIGVRGCFLSHYSLWISCIKENKPYVIFEHDAIMLRPLPENILNTFDEFLLLDPYNKMKDSYASNHQNTGDYEIKEYFNPRELPKYGVTHDYAMGLQGYIIKPKAAIKLIHDVKKNGYLPADIQCNKGVVNLQTVYPSIVSINSKFYNNKTLMKEESTTHKEW